MFNLATMGLTGILLVCASGLVLHKNGLSHAAMPMPKHNQAKIITAMMLQKQGYLHSSGMIPKKVSESKTPNIIVEESKEPPVVQQEGIKLVQIQPVKEEPILPLFPPAPTLAPALIPTLEETKKTVIEDKKSPPAQLPIQIQDEAKTTSPTPSQAIDLPRVFEAILGGLKSANIKLDKPKNGTITLGFGVGTPPFINVEVNNKLNELGTTKGIKKEISKLYLVRFDSENFQEIAKKTLGNEKRWNEIAKLNPTLKADALLEKGVVVKVPVDATLQSEEPYSAVQPLPEARPKLPDPKLKIIITLTGTYPCILNEKRLLSLPLEVQAQLGNCNQVLMSPGPDPCLWLTSADHLEKLSDRLEHSPANENDIRVFRRLFFGQIEKLQVVEGKIVIPERLAQFGCLEKEIAIIGVEDHFEIWDLDRWRKYTQKMSSNEKK